MVLELKQQLKLAQQLVMTPQLQQAIKLLQLSRLELTETVQQEIEQNPVLEEDTSSPENAGDDGDAKTDQNNAASASPTEQTTEVSMKDSSSLEEINWADYENEYETTSSFKSKDGPDLPSKFDILTKKPTLQDHLSWQLKFIDLSEAEREIATFIIGNLNRDGFLEASEEDTVSETGCGSASFQKVLALIQDMDPPGICARSIQECLLLQLALFNLGEALPSIIIRDHLHLLETKNYAAIVKATRSSLKEVLAAIEVIQGLNPHPGRAFSDEEPQYILPDVYVYKVDDEYVILLNDEGLPRLRISTFYQNIMKDKGDQSEVGSKTKEYIQEKLKSALWLIKSIQQRQRTIYKVVESLVKFQREFFDKGPAYLRPLILRDVAEDIDMHESTISRVTTNKYVHTPQGIHELKYFFNSSLERTDGGDSVASESIKVRIKSIVQQENSEKPLSDMALAKIFEKDGIRIARRTIAKYREQIGVLPSKYRRKPKV
jgi:RNA polymerase sigma-54 factor